MFSTAWSRVPEKDRDNPRPIAQIRRASLFSMADATHINFIFVCPETNKVFESSDFAIRDNRGVATDDAGNRTLDAKVALNVPCPFCGQKHVYPASELSCPFEFAGATGSSKENH